MSLKAYILINTKIGKTTEVAHKLMKMPEVKHLDIIMGPYDMIVLVETEGHETLSQIVMRKFQSMEYINHTMTCPVIRMEEMP
jgi:DNA-binding Lrp family transcriptional regulator